MRRRSLFSCNLYNICNIVKFVKKKYIYMYKILGISEYLILFNVYSVYYIQYLYRCIYYETHTYFTYNILMVYLFSNYYFTFEQPSSVDVGGARLTSAGQVRTLLFPTRGFPPTTHPLNIPGRTRKKYPRALVVFMSIYILHWHAHTRAFTSEWAISF